MSVVLQVFSVKCMYYVAINFSQKQAQQTGSLRQLGKQLTPLFPSPVGAIFDWVSTLLMETSKLFSEKIFSMQEHILKNLSMKERWISNLVLILQVKKTDEKPSR